MNNQNIDELRANVYELVKDAFVDYVGKFPPLNKMFEYEVMYKMFKPESELFSEKQLQAVLNMKNPFKKLQKIWDKSPDTSYDGRLKSIRTSLDPEYSEQNHSNTMNKQSNEPILPNQVQGSGMTQTM